MLVDFLETCKASSILPKCLQDAEKVKDLQRISNLKIEKIHQIMDILDVPRGKGDKV